MCSSDLDELRAKFDAEWGVAVPPKRGWHLSGMFDAMERGDLTAATQAGHAIAVLEMLIGQVYLVTVIAVLVSRLGHGPQTSPPRRSE